MKISNRIVQSFSILAIAVGVTVPYAAIAGAAPSKGVSLSAVACTSSVPNSDTPFGSVRADLAISRGYVSGSQTLNVTPVNRETGAVAGSVVNIASGQTTAVVSVAGDGLTQTPVLDLEVRKSGSLVSTLAVDLRCGDISPTPQSAPVVSYKQYSGSVTVTGRNPGVAADNFTYYLEKTDGTYTANPVTWNVRPNSFAQVNYQYNGEYVFDGLAPGSYKATVVGTYGEGVVHFTVGNENLTQ